MLGTNDQRNSNIVNKQESVLSLKQEAANDSYVIIEEMQAQIRSEQKNRESLREELKNCELKVADLDQRINFVSERIFDSYNTKIPGEMIVDQTENELNASIERIEKSIENIGPINMAVQIEHEEENERLLMLTDLTNPQERIYFSNQLVQGYLVGLVLEVLRNVHLIDSLFL